MKNNFSRRNFLIKTSKGIAGAAAVSALAGNLDLIPKVLAAAPQAAKNKASKAGKTCEFGVEGGVPREAAALDESLKAISELGAEFIVCQFAPKNFNPKAKSRNNGWTGTAKDFSDLALACRKYNLSYFANQEVTNYTVDDELLDEKGKDILAHPGNVHRWDIAGKALAEAKEFKEFRGVLYDEPEHGQMRRFSNTNGGSDSQSSHKVYPYFAATDGMTLEQAYDAVYNGAKAVAKGYRNNGVIPMTESVFPVMQSIFARAGFDVGVKFMKESIDPVYAAIAIGAARQYGTEFCAAPDLWGFGGNNWDLGDHFPGHPPEELRTSLLFAYWIGSTRIFVENIRGLTERKTENGQAKYELTEYGKVYQWFVKEYVPAHPRPYTFKEFSSEVAILRFEDTDWGQTSSRFADNLYGAVNLHTSPETNAWFKIWNLLTHGQTNETTISFNSKGYKGVSHDFFYPLNGVVVYDHLAGEKELDGLKLVFVTGVMISPQTLKAVQSFVRKGGLCVSLDSLSPEEFKGKEGTVSDGKGQWLFVKDFLSEEVKTATAPFLGKPDEISYQIGKQRLIVKCGKDRNTISIYLLKDKNDPLEESARVW
jgi:hypothetical protein